jgi:hypothetical protein
LTHRYRGIVACGQKRPFELVGDYGQERAIMGEKKSFGLSPANLWRISFDAEPENYGKDGPKNYALSKKKPKTPLCPQDGR